MFVVCFVTMDVNKRFLTTFSGRFKCLKCKENLKDVLLESDFLLQSRLKLCKGSVFLVFD